MKLSFVLNSLVFLIFSGNLYELTENYTAEEIVSFFNAEKEYGLSRWEKAKSRGIFPPLL